MAGDLKGDACREIWLNQTGYDILLQETDKKLDDFEFDLYWVVRSGNDPLQLF